MPKTSYEKTMQQIETAKELIELVRKYINTETQKNNIKQT